jgi:hypothetical protein
MYWKRYEASRGLWRVKCLESYPEGLGRLKKTDVSAADLWAKFRTSDLTVLVVKGGKVKKVSKAILVTGREGP